MKNIIISTIGALSLVSLNACIAPVANSPWDFTRTSRADTLAPNETQVRTQLISDDGDDVPSGAFVDIQYGLTDKLTLGASQGTSLRRASAASELAGEETSSVIANYKLDSIHSDIDSSIQLITVFKDDVGLGSGSSSVEYRPSIAFFTDSITVRTGVNTQAGFDTQFLIEGSYKRTVGDKATGTIEFDATFGDLDELYITPGIVIQMRELVQLQIGVPLGLNRESSDWQTLVGFSFRF